MTNLTEAQVEVLEDIATGVAEVVEELSEEVLGALEEAGLVPDEAELEVEALREEVQIAQEEAAMALNPVSAPRPHFQTQIQYALNSDALVFVNVGKVRDTDYFILVEHPLWLAERDYVLRTDMTLEEARADRDETLAQYKADKAANDAYVDDLIAKAEALR